MRLFLSFVEEYSPYKCFSLNVQHFSGMQMMLAYTFTKESVRFQL